MTVIGRRVADKLMPWVAANATVWPSTHANQAVLLEQIRELEAEAAANRGAVSLLAAIGQCANTHDALDETASVRVPLRLLRAARSTGTGGQ
jgi:hypothetical protein